MDNETNETPIDEKPTEEPTPTSAQGDGDPGERGTDGDTTE